MSPAQARRALRECNRADRRLFEQSIMLLADDTGRYDISGGVPKPVFELLEPSHDFTEFLDWSEAVRKQIYEVFA